MSILKQIYLYVSLHATNFKLINFSIQYKILTKFSYNFFFFLKTLQVKLYNHRVYLLNTNFHFLFIDYIYLISYFTQVDKQSCFLFTLPIKKKSYSILRSPFIYSKSRENFFVPSHYIFLDITHNSLSDIGVFFYTQIFYNIKLDNSKILYKRRVLL